MAVKDLFKVHAFPVSVRKEIKKCTYLLELFMAKAGDEGDKLLVRKSVMKNCKGIGIMCISHSALAFVGTKYGTGVVIARQNNSDQWSPPMCVGVAGITGGLELGMESIKTLIFLMTDAAVEAFCEGNVTLGAGLSAAAGPYGRDSEMGGAVQAKAAVYHYAIAAGIFCGVSFSGMKIVARKDRNQEFYGSSATPRDILKGNVRFPYLNQQHQGEIDKFYQTLDTLEDFYNNFHVYVKEAKQRKDEKKAVKAEKKLEKTRSSNGNTSRRSTYSSGSYNQNNKSQLYDKYDAPATTRPKSNSTSLRPNRPSYAAPRDNTYSISHDYRYDHKDNNNEKATTYRPSYASSYNSSYDSEFDDHVSAPPSYGRHIDVPKSQSYNHSYTPQKDLPPVPIHPKNVCRALAVYDYQGTDAADVCFQKGDPVDVWGKPGGWWYGKNELTGKVGFFPGEYVEIC